MADIRREYPGDIGWPAEPMSRIRRSNMRTLLTYYSRTGCNERACRCIEDELHRNSIPYDVEQIIPTREFSSKSIDEIWMEAFREEPQSIEPTIHDLQNYDIIVLMFSEWSTRISTPMLRYIVDNRDRFPNEILVLFMCRGVRFLRKKRMVKALRYVGRDVLACIALDCDRAGSDDFERTVRGFIRRFHRAFRNMSAE